MNVRAVILIALALFQIKVHAQNVEPQTVDKALPTYVRFVGDDPTEQAFEMSDSLFFRVSGATIFKVNKYDLNTRDQLIQDLAGWILPRMQEQNWELVGIALRGAASPEGPYDNNVRLSKRRAKALTDFLLKNMGQDFQDLMTTNTTAEDYKYLTYLMQDAKDKDAVFVKTLLEECNYDCKTSKKWLQKVDGGRLWRRLLREYYPQLRAARVVLYFKKKKPKLAYEATPRLGFAPPEPEPLIEIIPEEVPEPEPLVLDRPHMLSIGTNGLYDLFYMPNFGFAPSPNIQLEYYPIEGKWTYLAQFTFPYYTRWGKHKFFEIRDYHLEVRRYSKPGLEHSGLFTAAYVNYNKYGIGFSQSKGWQGEGAGAALKAGYVWNLEPTHRWRLELSAAFGGYLTRYDPYVYGNPITGADTGEYYYDYTGAAKDFHRRNYQRFWIGPTELNLTLRYDLLYHRLQKNGASFKRKEVTK